MTEIIPKKVAEGIKAIKGSGRCNINDSATVLKIALQEGFIELAALISNDLECYQRCIAHGFVSEEEQKVSSSKKSAIASKGVAQPKKSPAVPPKKG